MKIIDAITSFFKKKETIDLSASARPFIGGRAFNCIANDAYDRWNQFDKKLSVGEFLEAMKTFTDKDMMKWSNMGPVTIQRCRKAEAEIRRRMK